MFTWRICILFFSVSLAITNLYSPQFALSQNPSSPAKDQTGSRTTGCKTKPGNPESQFQLGWKYEEGDGVPRDQAKALECFRTAAERGHAGAQEKLAWLYLRGEGGLPQDDAAAAKWLLKAAEQGDALLQLQFGKMLMDGRGVAKDDAEAVKWFRKAANQNLAAAQVQLGSMFAQGRGVPQDDVEAVKWYRKAAERHDPEALYSLGSMYEQGRGVPKDLIEAYTLYSASGFMGHESARAKIDALGKQLKPEEIMESVRRMKGWLGPVPPK